MIELKDITKIYENGAKGLHGVSLTIENGEFVFIVGSSGSGKSSFVRLLLKEIEPTKGKILIDGKDIGKISRRDMPFFRRKMGVVFQDFRLLKNKTVYENVAFAMRIVEATNKEIRRTVPQVLHLVGLAKKAKAYPSQLSGGEQQRVSLARAIINKPPILIADEPTGNLDPDTAWDIMMLLNDINNMGTTVVVATHARDIVDDMQKRVVALGDGKVLRDTENSGYIFKDSIFTDAQKEIGDSQASSEQEQEQDSTTESEAILDQTPEQVPEQFHDQSPEQDLVSEIESGIEIELELDLDLQQNSQHQEADNA